MRVGFLGLGRLGLPIAAVLSQHHQVTGYDPDPTTAQRLVAGHDWEVGLFELLGNIALAESVDAATYDADVVVVCVQTPHEPTLDGTHPTSERAPFDLTYVREALLALSTDAPVVLMSTVLPGDCRGLSTLISGELIYAPAFPAMGTTIADVLNPEFVLVGTASGQPTMVPFWLWRPLGFLDPDPDMMSDPPAGYFEVSWETAELAKMAYNTAIGAKIALANTVGWLANEVGADGGQVMDILSQANRRITSAAYFQPGLGDGGACHPRDQIALSWLARTHGVYDFFSDIITQRSAHSEWVADVVRAVRGRLPVVILGGAYKANSTLTDGSPARLLSNQTGWPIVETPPTEPHCIVIGVPHDAYRTQDFSNHLVVDLWGVVDGAIQPGRTPQHRGPVVPAPKSQR